ncbi:hypothetical protein RhiJN_08038 [Ceratobasidium sp. AG-Ba]|nr:hypothetical protein RhiJN_08038 [Ceratobasidium sp. AG-Ba]QRW08820.1 hypothetical protein RhiLY_07819 [Ceratobasidium sp. AG-Ba]
MPLSDGNYFIVSGATSLSGKNLGVARYYDNLLLVNDYSLFPIKVQKTSGDKFTLQFITRPDDYFGSTNENNWVVSRPGKFEWAIDPAGGDQYKIHVPEKDLYWQLPEGSDNESRIVIDESQGGRSEYWTFKQA